MAFMEKGVDVGEAYGIFGLRTRQAIGKRILLAFPLLYDVPLVNCRNNKRRRQ